MNSSGEIQETWFGRTVICSAVKLAYEHAQDMLDNPVNGKSSKSVRFSVKNRLINLTKLFRESDFKIYSRKNSKCMQ